VRTHLSLPIAALLALCACSNASSSQASASASPAPLVSCETRQLQIDGADVELDANIDATLGAVVVIDSPDDAIRDRALADVRKEYGPVKPDARTTTRPWRLGLTRQTDMCGRPVGTDEPSDSPSPSSSP
jgi:hypothetical protein